jgi:hypothetical protein
MTGRFSHYYLMPDGELELKPTVAEACIPYLIEKDGQHRLCVIEGGAFHSFDITVAGLARLADEATKLLRTHLTR